MIENTLAAGRDTSENRHADLRDMHPRDVTTDLEEETTSLYDTCDLEISWDVPEDLPRLFSHPDKLKIILRNLVANAVKFTDRGTVRVHARNAAGGLEIVVADTGVGIQPDQLDAIFEEFRQGPAPDGQERGGVGLGLYIVRRMAEQLGGRVRAESTPGAGSTFTVWLPLRSQDIHTAA